MRARLSIIAAVAGLMLAGAPKALAGPIPVSPADGSTVIARVGPLIFQAEDPASPTAGQVDFHVSRFETTSGGVLSRRIESFSAGPVGSDPALYEARPRAESTWPFKPGTYRWQPVYHNCLFADPECFGEIQELRIDPLPPPTQTSPADDASIPYGGDAIFLVQDVPSYRRQDTHISIEFSRRRDLRADGTFANQYLLARPARTGEGVYRFNGTRHFAERPGTYYWMVERWDCSAEADCYVTNGQVRAFTVEDPVGTPVPDTTITRHPPRRTRKRRARFAFASNLPDASFQCHYTGGWDDCRSPQRFRRLKPGRYRFKVRAVRAGERDATPATWLFRVLRRR